MTQLHSKNGPPGDLAIWIFILAEMSVFGVLFVVYAFDRAHQVELFNLSQSTLNRTSGFINTLLLLTSSYFVVRSVKAIKNGNSSAATKWLSGGMLFGLMFLTVKSYEYHQEFSKGISIETNDFYMFYIALTLFHFLHVIMGLIIFIFILTKLSHGGYSQNNYHGIETGASFWHMVDLLWIILFPLIYVMH